MKCLRDSELITIVILPPELSQNDQNESEKVPSEKWMLENLF
jgi:hypothetical protein